MQTIRTGVQKHLTATLPTDAVNWVRYAFGLPFAVLYLVVWKSSGYDFPALSLEFLLFCLLASIAQIIATAWLVSLFSHRNFAVGTTYSKTEALQTAFLGAVLFSESISIGGVFAVIFGILGIIFLSLSKQHSGWKSLWSGIFHKSSGLGLGAGAGFSIAALCIRKATHLVDSENLMGNAALTLVVMLIMQMTLLGLYLLWKNPLAFRLIAKQWKWGVAVGITSALGSMGWFSALALQKAAYVKTLGQVEILFSLAATHCIFKESLRKNEILGITLTIVGILLLFSA